MAKKIKLDSRNYRKHSTENQEMINKSLRELGAGRSVLMDNEDELIAGNETYTQAQKLGLPIKIVESDGKSIITMLETSKEFFQIWFASRKELLEEDFQFLNLT